MCETLTRSNNGIGHQVALTDSNTDNQEISNNAQKVRSQFLQLVERDPACTQLEQLKGARLPARGPAGIR